MKTKRYDLGDVLSISDGRLVSRRHVDGVYDILNWMTQDNLYTHQLPRGIRECQSWLLRWFPELVEAGQILTEQIAKGGSVIAWLEAVETACPNIKAEYDVPQIPRDDHEKIDPVQEAKDLMGEDRVIEL